MATIRRRIDGPQDFHEQKGGQAFRDTRSVPHQIAEILRSGFSSIGLVAIAGVAVTVPALTTAIVPLAVAYAGYVLTRPVTLPLRLPANAKGKDYGNPQPDPKRPGVEIPGKPSGDWLIGWDEVTAQQVWLSGNDMTMHAILPGSTGSGKTQFIYSLLCNALAQGGGFTIVDGKASNNLAFSVAAMARRWGREADLRFINMMVSAGDRKTNTWNPFSSVNAEGMTELLLTLFLPEDKKGGGGNSAHFRDRAEALIRGMSYVFVWVRDNLGIPIMSETIRTMFSDIVKLRDLYQDQIFTYYDADTAETRKVELPPEFDRTLLNPVRDYVTETGGFSNTKSVGDQDKVREQHSYVVGGFGKTFTQMSSTLGHIFRCNIGDVDFRDVIFNRRILVVLLPSLENHPDTNAALGKAVITALRYALAAALGTSIEGDYEDRVVNRASSSTVPYPLVLDEVGQFATRGIDAMMALGRELNISLLISFQEVGTLYATLGKDLTVPLLGNPKLKIFENIEDSGPTREWIEQSGGTMPVSVLPGFDSSNPLGVYADQQRADIRDVKRISWSDVQNLRQGQAIILFRGKRIYTRLFYAGIKPEGVNRVFPTVSAAPALEAPVSEEPATEADDVAQRLQEGRDRIEKGDLRPLTGVLGDLYQRLGVVLNTEGTPLQDAQELLNLLFPDETSAEDKPFAKLFETLVPPSAQLPRTTESLHPDLDRALLTELVTFETALGLDERAAVEAVTHALNLYARGKELA